MKLIQSLIRSSFSLRQIQIPSSLNNRPFSAMPSSDYGQNQSDDFEQQSFSLSSIYKRNENSENRNPFNITGGNGSSVMDGLNESSQQSFSLSSIYKRNENSENRNPFNIKGGNGSSVMDGLNESSFDTSLTDGMDLKLKKAATFFEFDPDEVTNDDYTFRPDVNLQAGMTYDTKDLDLQNPGVRKPFKRPEFETTTEEVLRKADFRNVRFLAKFLTEAGIIIKRSKTGISAKAQRKVAREIKTARAFGLMPFTTMGTKHFVCGHSMEEHETDFGYEANEHNFVDEERE